MLLKNVWNIIERPRQTWQEIASYDWTVSRLVLRVLVPLALISPVAGFFGTTKVGWQIGVGGAVKLTESSALQISVVYFGAIIVSVMVIGALIHWMSETYGEKLTYLRSVSVAVYAAVPLFFAGIFQFYPVLWINFLIGLPALAYSVYLLYTGLPIVANISVERGFMFASAVLAVALVALVGLLVSTVVMWSFGIGPTFVS